MKHKTPLIFMSHKTIHHTQFETRKAFISFFVVFFSSIGVHVCVFMEHKIFTLKCPMLYNIKIQMVRVSYIYDRTHYRLHTLIVFNQMKLKVYAHIYKSVERNSLKIFSKNLCYSYKNMMSH